mgnify:FL=1
MSLKDYKVGDLFQAKGNFLHQWINNQVFIIVGIDRTKEDGIKLMCQTNGQILNARLFTMQRDMVKLSDI